jgi:hypothetical protein
LVDQAQQDYIEELEQFCEDYAYGRLPGTNLEQVGWDWIVGDHALHHDDSHEHCVGMGRECKPVYVYKEPR